MVQIDILELGPSRHGYHSVLVAYDVFSKWAEVMPLKRYDAESVALAFVEVCAGWGPPEVVRSDNGTEFVNAIVDSMLNAFFVTLKHGAVRHLQSYDAVEHFHRSLLTMIRNLHEKSID